MANFRIISNIPTRAFTSAFDKVEIETDLSKVRVTVIATGLLTVYDNILYAYDGKVIIYDLTAIFEESMRKHDIAFAFMWMRVCEPGNTSSYTSITYGTFYGIHRFYGNLTDWTARNFLNAAPAKMSFAGSVEVLNYWYPGGNFIREKRTVVYEVDGEQLVYETTDILERPDNTQVRQVIIDYKAIAHELNASRILSVCVAHNERMATIYYTDAPVIAFLFRNNFNTLDVATVQGEIKRKAETEKGIAVCNRKIALYNKRDRYSFEVETAPMPYDQVAILEQLCTSHKVWLYVNGIEPNDHFKVVITDYNVEISDSDEKLQTVKFTFQFEDYRLAMTEDLSEIFTTHFLPQFN